ncbi:MAG: sigma-54-dependent transcriptional regulator [Planctomycetaceae bacterium]
MNVLLADDERSIAITLRDDLRAAGHKVTVAEDGRVALGHLQAQKFDLLITDIRMPGLDGIHLLKQARELDGALDVIVITGHGTIATAVEAIRHGAYDYVLKPFLNEDLLRRVATLGEFRRLKIENAALRSQLGADCARSRIIGESEPMRKILEVVRTIAESDEDVLLEGETGTGKELVAKLIHDLSPRREGPFVVLSCSAFPRTLLEDEVFGHEKGAFTDARTLKKGRFERANGGTLFLDDIDDMALETQVKLLRVLQERTLERLGGVSTIRLDVRVVTATKIDLASSVEDGEFREDLYHRINIIPVKLPPLRERHGDVPVLLEHFLRTYGKGRAFSVDDRTRERLAAHSWPGNVRELENAVRRAIAMAGAGTVLSAEHLLLPAPQRGREEPEGAEAPVDRALRDVVRDAETAHIRRVLKHAHNHRANAARLLGISRKNLWEKMRDLGITDVET